MGEKVMRCFQVEREFYSANIVLSTFTWKQGDFGYSHYFTNITPELTRFRTQKEVSEVIIYAVQVDRHGHK